MSDRTAEPRTPTARRALVNSGLPDPTVEELRRIFIAIEAEAAAPAGLDVLQSHAGHVLGVIPPSLLVCDTCEVELLQGKRDDE